MSQNDISHYILNERPGKQIRKGHTMKPSIVRWVLLSLVVLVFSTASFGQIAVGVSVRIGPPALPVYAQPICPGPGYFWTPGYWAWNDDGGYYWVPGTWVVAPVGLLWTPGWWGWGGGVYAWHAGYWGPHVGFYGGINYGFGYTGVGFFGGEWRGGAFYYNRSVTNVSVTNVTNVYNKTVIVNRTTVSYNGGAGGVNMRPTPQEESYARERHTPALASQIQQEHGAMQNRENFASVNHGRPAIAATGRPGDFSARSAVAARAAGGEYHSPTMSPREARASSVPVNRGNSTPGNRGNANEGFRPFTPPSHGGNSNASMNANRGNSTPANHGNSTPANRGGSNEGFRPFSPPSGGGNANANRGGNRNQGGNANRGNEGRPQNQPQESHSNQGASQNRGNPQPQHHAGPPPKEEHHH